MLFETRYYSITIVKSIEVTVPKKVLGPHTPALQSCSECTLFMASTQHFLHQTRVCRNFSLMSRQISFFVCEFSIQNPAAGCAAHRVVRKCNKFVIENRTLSQTSNCYGHGLVRVAIFLWFRAIAFIAVDDGLLGCHRQIKCLRLSAEFLPYGKGTFDARYLLFKFYIHACKMPIRDRHTIAVRRNLHAFVWRTYPFFYITEYFEWFLFRFLFLASDVRHDIVDHIE